MEFRAWRRRLDVISSFQKDSRKSVHRVKCSEPFSVWCLGKVESALVVFRFFHFFGQKICAEIFRIFLSAVKNVFKNVLIPSVMSFFTLAGHWAPDHIWTFLKTFFTAERKIRNISAHIF